MMNDKQHVSCHSSFITPHSSFKNAAAERSQVRSLVSVSLHRGGVVAVDRGGHGLQRSVTHKYAVRHKYPVAHQDSVRHKYPVRHQYAFAHEYGGRHEGRAVAHDRAAARHDAVTHEYAFAHKYAAAGHRPIA